MRVVEKPVVELTALAVLCAKSYASSVFTKTRKHLLIFVIYLRCP